MLQASALFPWATCWEIPPFPTKKNDKNKKNDEASAFLYKVRATWVENADNKRHNIIFFALSPSYFNWTLNRVQKSLCFFLFTPCRNTQFVVPGLVADVMMIYQGFLYFSWRCSTSTWRSVPTRSERRRRRRRRRWRRASGCSARRQKSPARPPTQTSPSKIYGFIPRFGLICFEIIVVL